MFQGFSKETQEFLWGVRLNNERPWFLAHKNEYDTHVLAPLRALGEQVYETMEQEYPKLGLGLHVCRIYRDARRLHGQGPYKDHMWFTLHRPRDREAGNAATPAFYFEIAPEYYSMGMGCYDATPLTMAKLRARIDADPKSLEKLARKLERQDALTLEGRMYKKSMGEVSPLLAPWYNRRNIAITCDQNWDELVLSPALPEAVLERFRFLVPYYQYLESLSADPDPRDR